MPTYFARINVQGIAGAIIGAAEHSIIDDLKGGGKTP
jgi:hypothetical protein